MAERGGPLPSGWLSALEYGLFGWVFLGVAALWGIVLLSPPAEFLPHLPSGESMQGNESGIPAFLLAAVAVTGLATYSLLFHAVAAVSLAVDATRVREADLGWKPHVGGYAVGGLLLSGLVVLAYLWQRFRYVEVTPAPPRWRTLTVACIVVGVLSLVVGFLGPATVLLAQVAVLPLLAAAVYQDARTVAATTGWRPNPVTYFLATLLSGILLVGPYLVGGYYLLRRRAAS